MFGGSSLEIDHEAAMAPICDEDWKVLHRRLRSIARRRIALEAEEARCLVEAEESRLYRRLGYATMTEYMQRELHWGPHAAMERLRVARELIDLPRIAQEFRSGELSFSAVRELTRVATPETEAEFVECARGKTARQVEHLVAGKTRGDRPDTPPDPTLIKKRLVLELSPEQYALWRRNRAALEDEHGGRLSDGEVLGVLMRRANEAPAQGVTRPAVQASVTTCKTCKRSVTAAAGEQLPLDPATAERMWCDADVIGDLESDEPTRVTSTVPQGIRRKVFVRDRFGCVVPGCRAARNLDVHHVVHREHGGDHSLSNLAVLCSGHHQRLHEGLLAVRGRAPDLVFAWHRDDDVDSAMTRGPMWDGEPTDEDDDNDDGPDVLTPDAFG